MNCAECAIARLPPGKSQRAAEIRDTIESAEFAGSPEDLAVVFGVGRKVASCALQCLQERTFGDCSGDKEVNDVSASRIMSWPEFS